MSELGPASKVLLDRVNLSFSYVEIGTLVSWARAKTGHGHSTDWWYRRLVALALEGRIDAKVYRTGDDIAIKFRKKVSEERRGFTLGLDAVYPPGETVWLTLTELQSWMPGAPTKHVLTVWENGRRKEAEG